MPASSSKNEVCVTDLYFLDKLETGFGDIVGVVSRYYHFGDDV